MLWYVIALARTLDIQYVWIDSICIVQDNVADLRGELVNMAQYYQPALFTLAAELESKPDNEEMSIPRPFTRLVRLPYREGGKQRGHYYVLKQSRRTKVQYLTQVNQSVLLSRGWVFQEWFLSPRILHLTPSNTFLECRAQAPFTVGNQDVNAPDTTPNMPIIFNSQRLQESWFGLKSQLSSSSKLELRVWYELMAQFYSRLSLTKASDHLNAIAGIAAEFTNVMNGLSFSSSATDLLESTTTCSHSSYASGLWLPDIHHGLLWRGASEALKVCDCGAPSWSWLALKGQIAWPGRHPKTVDCCKIVSAIRDVERNPSSYLITMADMLHLKGKIQPVLVCGRLTAALDRDLAILTGDKIYAKEIHQDKEDLDNRTTAVGTQGRQIRQLISPITAPTAAVGWGTFERPDLLQLRADGQSYLVNALQISTRDKVGYRKLDGPSVEDYGHTVTDVLFVEPVAGTPDQFRRIGVGAIYEPLIIHAFDEMEATDMLLV
ncbi:hypothetical protein ACHAPV_009825 [Trichoderma viride]